MTSEDPGAGRFPTAGTPADEVLERMQAMRVDDNDWRAGRTFSLVYTAGPEVHELLERAHDLRQSGNRRRCAKMITMRPCRITGPRLAGRHIADNASTAGQVCP